MFINVTIMDPSKPGITHPAVINVDHIAVLRLDGQTKTGMPASVITAPNGESFFVTPKDGEFIAIITHPVDGHNC